MTNRGCPIGQGDFETMRRSRRRGGRFFNCPPLTGCTGPSQITCSQPSTAACNSERYRHRSSTPCRCPQRSKPPMKARSDACFGSLVVKIPYVGGLARNSGADGEVITTSGICSVPSIAVIAPATAPVTIQCAHGYSGCSGVMSMGSTSQHVCRRVVIDVAVANGGDRTPEGVVVLGIEHRDERISRGHSHQ